MDWAGGRRAFGALTMTALAAVTVAGCSPSQRPADSVAIGATVTMAPTGEREVREAAEVLEDVLDAVEAEHGGVAGISVATEHGIINVGSDGRSRAWSTIKVPIAIAAMQQKVGTESMVRAAISESSNEDAAALWAALGGGAEAAASVDSLLWRYNGVAHTRPTVDEYPDEPTPIGWIPWTLNGQAGFASRLACIPEVDVVWDAMGEIVPWQQSGLGRISGMHFKGGWSQEEDGLYSYTYRQFGALPSDDGVLGVAIIAHPEDGRRGTAERMLDDLADGISRSVEDGSLVASDHCVLPDSLKTTEREGGEPVDLP